MHDYQKEIFEGSKKGAIMLGVCRGRISEGIDFSDHLARLVVVVGIPYAQKTDARVTLKKYYLNSKLYVKPK